MQRRWMAACAVAALVVGGGCASEADDLGGDPPGDTAGAEADRDADEAAAEAALLTLDDLPTGWQEEPPEPEDDDGMEPEMAECLGIDQDEADTGNPRAESPSFVSPDDAQTVFSSVALAATADETHGRIAVMAGEAAPSCYAEAIQGVIDRNLATSDLPEGVEVGEATVDRLSFDDVGDESAAFRGTMPFTYLGTELELYADFVFVRVGRAGVTLLFLSELSPFDTDEAARLTQIVVDRIDDAAAD